MSETARHRAGLLSADEVSEVLGVDRVTALSALQKCSAAIKTPSGPLIAAAELAELSRGGSLTRSARRAALNSSQTWFEDRPSLDAADFGERLRERFGRQFLPNARPGDLRGFLASKAGREVLETHERELGTLAGRLWGERYHGADAPNDGTEWTYGLAACVHESRRFALSYLSGFGGGAVRQAGSRRLPGVSSTKPIEQLAALDRGQRVEMLAAVRGRVGNMTFALGGDRRMRLEAASGGQFRKTFDEAIEVGLTV